MYTVGLDVLKVWDCFIPPNLFNILSIDFSTILINGSLSVLIGNLDYNEYSIDVIKEVLVGSILGDGTIEIGERNTNARFKMLQSVKNEHYLFMLFGFFSQFCLSAPYLYSNLDKRTNKVYSNWSFKSRALPLFTEFLHLFYKDGIKIIPSTIFHLLTPLALAHWLIQDGSFNKASGGCTLCTDSFTEEEVRILIGVLSTKYNLHCSLQKAPNKGQFRIYIFKRSMPTLRNLVLPFFHSSMLYKLGL